MSGVTVSTRDETTSGDVLATLDVQLQAEQTTVAEVIRARVAQEVRAHNASAVNRPFAGLVKPTETEEQLNGQPRGRGAGRRIDEDAQIATALRAFERGQVLVLVDDEQVTEPDEPVTLTSGSTVTFLKLVPLIGG